ncbi:segregation and condensation protein A [Candidatus Magnetomoraceae bacterium gMMP-1]
MTDSTNYKIILDVFEGPVDLLVHLIRKNRMDIHDIPIGLITKQYLTYLERMEAVNVEFGGEFLVLASTLTQIKSKRLLPVHSDKEDKENGRQKEIEEPLIEYINMIAAAKKLSERNRLDEDVFIRNPEINLWSDKKEDEMIEVNFFELIDAFQKILNTAQNIDMNLTADGISVRDRISQLIDVFEEKNQITFEELFISSTKIDMIVTFLAVLEMVKLNVITIIQNIENGIITISYI